MLFHKLTVGSVGTNCYILRDDNSKNSAVIDPGENADEIYSHLKKNNCELSYIILTHGHFDHVTAVEPLIVKTGASVMLHKNDYGLFQQTCKNININIDIYAEDNDIIKIGETNLRVIHTPGHTPGSICLLYKEHLFAGDTLFFEDVGRCDLPGGDFEAIKKSIREKLFILPDDTRVYPGHGEYTSIGHEKKYNPYVKP